jgi:hypothetical protein
MQSRVEKSRDEKPKSSSGRGALPLILRLLAIFEFSSVSIQVHESGQEES